MAESNENKLKTEVVQPKKKKKTIIIKDEKISKEIQDACREYFNTLSGEQLWEYFKHVFKDDNKVDQDDKG